MVEIELDILPSGEVRFSRDASPEKNQALLAVLSEVAGVSTVEEIREFFEAGGEIELLFGDEQFCG